METGELSSVLSATAPPPCVECERLNSQLRAAWRRVREAFSVESRLQLSRETHAELQSALEHRRVAHMEMADHRCRTGHRAL